jgi:hypothetical protein
VQGGRPDIFNPMRLRVSPQHISALELRFHDRAVREMVADRRSRNDVGDESGMRVQLLPVARLKPPSITRTWLFSSFTCSIPALTTTGSRDCESPAPVMKRGPLAAIPIIRSWIRFRRSPFSAPRFAHPDSARRHHGEGRPRIVSSRGSRASNISLLTPDYRSPRRVLQLATGPCQVAFDIEGSCSVD